MTTRVMTTAEATEKLLAEFVPPTAEHIEHLRSLNSPLWLIENAQTPHLTTDQEEMVYWVEAYNVGSIDRKVFRAKLRKLGTSIDNFTVADEPKPVAETPVAKEKPPVVSKSKSTADNRHELIVETVELKDRKPFRPNYYFEGSIDEFFLNVTARTIDGDIVYFNTPSLERRVGMPRGCPVAVVTYDDSNDWMLSPEAFVVGPNEHSEKRVDFTPTIAEGDHIIITGRVKKEYRTGYSLNYVKLIANNH